MDINKNGERLSIGERIRRSLHYEAEIRKTQRGALMCDILVFAVALFFARRHIAFGAYPLGLAFVATLPSRVWLGLLGAVIGSVSLGSSGVIHGAVCLVVVLLRIAISGGKRDSAAAPLFREPYVMRVASATIGAFVAATYEILLGGFALPSVLFGVAGVLMSCGFCFVFYGLYTSDVSFSELLYSSAVTVLPEESDRKKKIIFLASGAAFAALVCYSLSEYSFFGITLGYIAATMLTLFTAKRLGTLYSMSMGFVSVILISARDAVAFALAGLGAGFLFKIGVTYAIVGGGLLLAAWGGYAGGLNGFLSVFPEYSATAIALSPFLKTTPREQPREKTKSANEAAADMVGAMLLSYRDSLYQGEGLEQALMLSSDVIKDYGEGDGEGDFEGYRNALLSAISSVSPQPCEENIDILTTKIYKKQKLTEAELAKYVLGIEGAYEGAASELSPLLGKIKASVGEYERLCYGGRRMEALCKEYELISKLLNENKLTRQRERAVDGVLSEKAESALRSLGFPDAVAKVTGDRAPHVIAAMEDAEGKRVTDPSVKTALEGALNISLGKFEYYRKGEMVLFECTALPSMGVEYFSASSALGESCGDTACGCERRGVWYSVLSDGMGTGQRAMKTSRFVSDFISNMCAQDRGLKTTLSSLNHIIRHKGEECSATVDLFSIDLISGEAFFLKCGAAPSYIKRQGSLFRIRSGTAPIGLMSRVDAEKISVEIKPGDYVIMLSDGVSILPEDSPWLLELLNRDAPESTEEYARLILSEARKKSKISDDMTVSVMRIA